MTTARSGASGTTKRTGSCLECGEMEGRHLPSCSRAAPDASPLSSGCAALLNLTGTGAGYLLQRRWGRWAAYATLAVLLLLAASVADLWPSPRLWQVVLAVWVVAAGADAWRYRRKAVGPWPGRLVAAVVIVAAALLIGETLAIRQYRTSGRQEFAMGLVAHREADCTRAIRHYQRVTTFYELTLSSDVRRAHQGKSECEEVMAADGARRRSEFRVADGLYRAFVLAHPDGPLTAYVRRAIAQTNLDWGTQLRTSGRHADALERYRTVVRESEELPTEHSKAKAELSETFVEWATALRKSHEYQSALDRYGEMYAELAGSPDEQARARVGTGETYLEWATRHRTSGSPVEAIAKYTSVLRGYSDTPAGAGAASGLRELLDAARSDIAGDKPCEAVVVLDALVKTEEAVAADASAATPGALFGCGELRYGRKQFAEAATQFRQLLERFPQSDLGARTAARLIDAEVGQAKGGATSPLPAPQVSGSAPGRSVLVTIRNDSPERLEILASGPTSKRVVIEPCSSCQRQFVAPLGCPAKGPEVEISLEPGQYEVVAKALSSPSVRPFSGTWPLSSATRYSSCLYIVQRF